MTDRIKAVGLGVPKSASTKAKEHTAGGGCLRSLESLRILAALTGC